MPNQSIEEFLLRQQGAQSEDMSLEETEVYSKMLEQVKASQITPKKFEMYMRDLILVVEREIVEEPEYVESFFGLFRRENRKHLMLKARLKNYLFIEAFLTSPARAERQLEEVTRRIGKSKNV